MSDQRTTKAAATETTSGVSELAQAIVTAMQTSQGELADAIVKATQASAPPRQLTFDEVSPVSPFNPKGLKNRELPGTIYQNGVRLHVETCHDEEIALLGKLKPGRFVDGLVTVIEREVGGAKVLHINHDGRTADQRIRLKGEVRNFTELLRRCVNEAKG